MGLVHGVDEQAIHVLFRKISPQAKETGHSRKQAQNSCWHVSSSESNNRHSLKVILT
jgi:hypothetical protein